MKSTSWLEIDPESPFSIENIPFGIVSKLPECPSPSPAVAIGDHCVILKYLAENGAFSELPTMGNHLEVFTESNTLNAFASLGRQIHQSVRLHIRELLLENTQFPQMLKENTSLRNVAIHRLSECTVHLPMRIGDYTDFYAGLNHAYNVGVMFRGPQNALQPNYTHLPVGYHGRASTVRVSGYPVRRPYGQILDRPGDSQPIFGPCRKLDIELELAAFICKGNDSDQEPISIAGAEEHIFGYVLMNDWSARDIQQYEYVPLGPFLSKNFATTISPWIVLADALEPFRCQSMLQVTPANDASTNGEGHLEMRQLLPYLREDPNAKTHFNINLSVELRPAEASQNTKLKESAWNRISSSNSAYLLYSFPQMLAHHTITGCEMNTGDLLGSGTISGPTKDSLGSLLEMTENGKLKLKLKQDLRSPSEGDDIERVFLQDGDEVRITGCAGSSGGYVGFGECYGKILPARQTDFSSS